jgi:pyruvate formate lyase activating enzyme
MKGCPLRCIWCSNPESKNSLPEIALNSSLCQKCGHCVNVCETQAISLNNDTVNINRKMCTVCGKCVEVCVPKALKIFGKVTTAEDVYQEVVRDKPFYQNSSGGVTISGGEPLLQADFAAELFKKCQDASIHTCLDTCGYADPGDWRKVLPYTNLILFDIKLMDSFLHRKLTGKSNEKILRSLEIVATSRIPVIIRIPIIPSINDTDTNINDIANYITGLKGLNIREVNLLPYHRFGVSKYAMLGQQYSLSNLKPPDYYQLEEFTMVFKSLGLDCRIVM